MTRIVTVLALTTKGDVTLIGRILICVIELQEAKASTVRKAIVTVAGIFARGFAENLPHCHRQKIGCCLVLVE